MKQTILGFIAFIACLPLQAQVEFSAVPSRNVVALNERVRVDFIMNQNGDNFTPPDFEGFRASGPSQSISQSYVNGKSSFQKTFSYILQPIKKGRLVIGQATVEIEGEIYKTSPVSIDVTEAIDQPNDANTPAYAVTDQVHLVASASKSSPFINEPIKVEYRLYVAPQTGVRNWREIDAPKFKDFWSHNIDIKQLKVENGTYQGKPYRYVVLRQSVLYPQKSGKLKIDPLTLDIAIEVDSGKRSRWTGFAITDVVEKTVSANVLYLDVKDLPTASKPVDFSGAVGNFDLKVVANKNSLNAGESLEVSVEISGKGNLNLIDRPQIKFPSALEVFDPEYTENLRTTSTGTQGSVADKYTIIAQEPGRYIIPPISFSYFDLEEKKYKQLQSNEIVLEVGGSPVAANSTSSNYSNNKNFVPAKGNFAYIKTDTKLQAIQKSPLFGSAAHWAGILGLMLLIPLLIVVRKKREAVQSDVEGLRLKHINKLAKKYLGEAKKQLKNPDGFYEALERALHNFLKAKLHIETNEMQKENIEQLLLQKGIDVATTSHLLRVLTACEYSR
ncbi:MAG: BatD family protein, partial [Flavobacteriaceae bacterium]|nr:BatD family protein [Flavobacteriaceae bacterium]